MTPLEKRLIEDMKLFVYSKRTQDTYLYAVRKLTNHFKKSSDQIFNGQLRMYLLWHKDKYAPNTTIPIAVGTLWGRSSFVFS